MVAKYVVVVHNKKWGDTYKEFNKKVDAIKYRCECNFDMNTYAWLYKYVEVSEETENKIMEKLEGKREKKESKEIPSDPLKELESRLNKAHEEYLNTKPKTTEYTEKKDIYMELANEYQKMFKKSLKQIN